jgi:hypothetical protein
MELGPIALSFGRSVHHNSGKLDAAWLSRETLAEVPFGTAKGCIQDA